MHIISILTARYDSRKLNIFHLIFFIQDGLNSYQCLCPNSFSGINCETVGSRSNSILKFVGGVTGGLLTTTVLVILLILCIVLLISRRRKKTMLHGDKSGQPTTYILSIMYKECICSINLGMEYIHIRSVGIGHTCTSLQIALFHHKFPFACVGDNHFPDIGSVKSEQPHEK